MPSNTLSLCLLNLLAIAIAAAYDSHFDLNAAKRYVTLCGASYCTDPAVQPQKNSIDDWSCKACQAYPNIVATTFHSATHTDANGFVGYDSDANEVIVAFAGTNPLSIQNWIDDLDMIQTDYPLCPGCKVHEGFYRSYNSVRDTVRGLIDSYREKHQNATLAITGHSLGAAMAAHCGADLDHLGYKISTTYTYGMPRVGEALS